MARRKAQYILVCEDQQHEAFVRRFLREMGLLENRYQLRAEPVSAGRGSAEQFVRREYVKELAAGRQSHVDRTLIIVIDGDNYGVEERLRQLDKACEAKGVDVRSPKDKVAIFIPTWNIETWLAYLDGNVVDEGQRDYTKLPRLGDCTEHARNLAAMCKSRKLRVPAPRSLEAACLEYNERLR